MLPAERDWFVLSLYEALMFQIRLNTHSNLNSGQPGFWRLWVCLEAFPTSNWG